MLKLEEVIVTLDGSPQKNAMPLRADLTDESIKRTRSSLLRLTSVSHCKTVEPNKLVSEEAEVLLCPTRSSLPSSLSSFDKLVESVARAAVTEEIQLTDVNDEVIGLSTFRCSRSNEEVPAESVRSAGRVLSADASALEEERWLEIRVAGKELSAKCIQTSIYDEVPGNSSAVGNSAHFAEKGSRRHSQREAAPTVATVAATTEDATRTEVCDMAPSAESTARPPRENPSLGFSKNEQSESNAADTAVPRSRRPVLDTEQGAGDDATTSDVATTGPEDDNRPKPREVCLGWCITERLLSGVHGVIDRIVRPDEQFSCEDVLPSFPLSGQVERIWDACCGGSSTGAVDSPVPSSLHVNDDERAVPATAGGGSKEMRAAVSKKRAKKRGNKCRREAAVDVSARDATRASSLTGGNTNALDGDDPIP